MIEPIEFVIPLRVGTGLNAREHHMARARRVEHERTATRAAFLMLPASVRWALMQEDLRITLTRIGPRRVDDDGATGGLKAVRDAIAACVGRDDGDESLRFVVAVERGPYAVRVRFESLAACCPACGRPYSAA